VAVRDGDSLVIVDAGSGTLGRMVSAGLNVHGLTGMCFTHIHPDHVADLVPILFGIKHTPGIRRGHDIPIFGPPSFQRFYDDLMKVFGQWCVGEEYEIVTREVEDDRFTLGSLRVGAIPVAHSVPAVGYRFESPDGGIVAITGDTGPTDRLTDLARGADVLIAECSLPEGTEYDGHMNARQVGELAAAAGVKRLLLSHLYPVCDEVDVVGQAKAGFDGRVEKASDLLSFEV